MRKTHYPKTRGRRQYAGLILSVCTAIGLSGWSGCSHRSHQPQTPPRPSPIRVSDGSMVVHTKSPWTVKQGAVAEVDIDGGQTCWISVNGSTPTPWKEKDWSITSSDTLAKVRSTNSGANIIATGPDVRDANPDPQFGPGKEFGSKKKVQFSPADLTAGLPACPKSGKCTIVIDYQASCP